METIQPVRYQLHRTLGYVHPKGSVIVDRRTVWGNPFVIKGPYPKRSNEGFPFRIYFERKWDLGVIDKAVTKEEANQKAVDLFAMWFSTTIAGNNTELYQFRQRFDWQGFTLACVCRKVLHGKSLGCWCGPDVACHAGVILRIANPELVLP